MNELALRCYGEGRLGRIESSATRDEVVVIGPCTSCGVTFLRGMIHQLLRAYTKAQETTPFGSALH